MLIVEKCHYTKIMIFIVHKIFACHIFYFNKNNLLLSERFPNFITESKQLMDTVPLGRVVIQNETKQ